MWWWDKAHPLALYMDKRVDPPGVRPDRPNWSCEPDVVGDFRAMPFGDESFNLVVFDPPHIVRRNPSGVTYLYYGALHPDAEQGDLRDGFAECWRVLAPGGTLVFKWGGDVKRVQPYFPTGPTVGTRGGARNGETLGTRWFIFYKPVGVQPRDAT